MHVDTESDDDEDGEEEDEERYTDKPPECSTIDVQCEFLIMIVAGKAQQ